jgi:hypothetical protein
MIERTPVKINGEWCYRYGGDTHLMTDSWKRFIEQDIARAWAWRRWGIDPPVGCNHSMSWQVALLAMMPLVYLLVSQLAALL